MEKVGDYSPNQRLGLRFSLEHGVLKFDCHHCIDSNNSQHQYFYFFNIISVHKEPPYVLKESGYASFNLPIDIYFKAGARDDPKKYSTIYDLDIYKVNVVTRHPITIQNPSTEFRSKLLDGGGIPVNDGK